MSSSPSPTTSTRAATISSRQERRSNSFPSLAALNPFRSKSAPEPSRPHKPFLVTPHIWSTDATAKVFGYIETDASGRPKLARSVSAGPGKRSTSFAQRKSPASNYKEVRADDRLRGFRDLAHRQSREAWAPERQLSPVGVQLGRENRARRSSRGGMRTVSQDDELTERGANPRTGVVSPYVMSDGSADSAETGYIMGGYARSQMSSTGRRTSSGRWQQTGASWSFVESAVPSPTRLSSNDKPDSPLPGKKAQGSLVAPLPGVNKPKQDPASNEQIKRYQQSVERAYELAGGKHAMVDPESLPSPRQASPAFGTERPSTPPKKLQKIRRKEVGSAPIPAEKSEDTMVVNNKQRPVPARLPPIRIPSMDRQHVRIISPSMAALGVPARTPLDIPASFLGAPQQCYQTASAGQSRSTHPLSPQTNQQGHHHPPQSQGHTQGPPEACSAPRVSSPTLSQFLPRLQLLHPSHFANLESPSYRRPAHLLPPSLRSGPQKRELVEDAATITTTIITGQKKQRPGMQRSEGRKTVPQASHHDLEDHISRENNVQSQAPSIKVFEPSSPKRNIGGNEDTTWSGYQQTLLHPSYPKPKEARQAFSGRSKQSNESYLLTQPRTRSKAPGVRYQDTSPGHMCHPPIHPTVPTARSHNHGPCPASLCPIHLAVPTVTSSEPTDRMKEVTDTSNMITDPTHRTLLRPCQPIPGGTGNNVLQANPPHVNPQSSQSHQRMVSGILKESETTKPTTIHSEKKGNGSQQSLKYPGQASMGSDGVVHAARVAMLGNDPHQHQRVTDSLPQKAAGPILSSNRTENVRGAHGTASAHRPRNRDGSGTGITQARDLQDRSISAPENGTDTNTPAKAKEGAHRTKLAPQSEHGIHLAGKRIDNACDDTDASSITTLSTNAEELLSRQQSLLLLLRRRKHDLSHFLAAAENFPRPKVYLHYIQDSLWHMIFHVASTLHYGSPALNVLSGSSGFGFGDGDEKVGVGSKQRLLAAKEVVLAVAYLLVLLNVAMFVRRVVMVVVRVGWWVWHPLDAVGGVVRWCLIT